MADRMPRAQVVRLAPAGHMSVFERHDQLTSALEQFAETMLGGSPTISKVGSPIDKVSVQPT
jgi:hypothetical protein